ncbi:MAG: hypothetical protein LQ348_001130 [Seirophora lacunosa]|nr:MAG: hypothetical protein LQ348_001130 [Seirophora lacunosa]
MWIPVCVIATTITLSFAAQVEPSFRLLQNKGHIIHDCDTRTDQVSIALELGKEPLAAAIKVAKQGTSGSHGFRAFWKTDANVGPVTKMLQDVYSLRPARGMRPNPLRAQLPEFVCVKPDTFWRYNIGVDPYIKCEQTGFFSMWLRGFKYVFICEKYFNMTMSPIGPPAKYCVPVIENKFNGRGDLLGDYQKYILVHELVHFYLGRSSLGWSTNPKENYRMNQCVNMDPKNSLKNPMHYQYFLASKSPL